MKIVIAGAGEVGYHLIENLVKEDSDIVVIDSNAEVLEKLKSNFKVKTDHSNITDSKYMSRIHLEDTPLFLAVTNSDETNMIACKIAAEAGVDKTICRIKQIDLDSGKRQLSLESLGIDIVINPISLAADKLVQQVITPNITANHEFAGGRITLTGYRIRGHSKILNKSIGELKLQLGKNSFRIGIIRRKERSFVPSAAEIIRKGDVVYFIYRTKDYMPLRKFLGYKLRRSGSQRVFINGGGQIGFQLAQKLENAGQNVKVIEKNIARSYQIAEKLEDSLVLNFDGTNLKQLSAEGIENADYFIAVTDNEQINLTSCLLACCQGVERTICLVDQQELVPIVDQNTPIGLAISPRVLTAKHLVQFIRGNNMLAYFSLANSRMEVLEIHLDENSPCLKSPLESLGLPENVIVAGIQREHRFLLPKGDDCFFPDDVILVILHRLDRPKVMPIFQSQTS